QSCRQNHPDGFGPHARLEQAPERRGAFSVRSTGDARLATRRSGSRRRGLEAAGRELAFAAPLQPADSPEEIGHAALSFSVRKTESRAGAGARGVEILR